MRRALLAMTGLALTGCQTIPADAPGASADLQPTGRNKATGTVHFYQMGNRVRVIARVAGLVPGREHGFHIHEQGDCGDADFKNAGGHFNPTGAAHGAPGDAAHHAGDLGNIEIAADGSGMLSVSTSLLTVAEGPNSVAGRAVILHEKADDLKTQPTGDAGGRIACGVIETGTQQQHDH